MTHIDQNLQGMLANAARNPDGIPDVDGSITGTLSPTLSFTGITDIEAQVLRDGLPFTRPTRWAAGLDTFEPGKLARWKLFPGSNNLGESVGVAVVNLGYSAPQWCTVEAVLMIDQIPFPSRPGHLFMDEPMWTYGGWSCIINFPIMSDRVSLRGQHTLLLRSVAVPVA